MTRKTGTRYRSAAGALVLLVAAVLFALTIGPGGARAAGGTYRITAGGDQNWGPESGGIDLTSSDPISKADTLVGSLGAVGQAHYELQAGPGVVRTKIDGSVSIPGGLFYPFNPSTQAVSSTELTVGGPPGFVNVSINLHVDGILDTPVCTGNNPNCGGLAVAVSAGIFVQSAEFNTVEGVRFNGLGLDLDPIPGGYHVHGDVTLPPFGVPTNTPVGIPILVNLSGRFGASATFDSNFDDPAIQYQVSFPTSGPVLDVPPGYTVSGPNVTDNHWTDPFASDVVVTDCADPALASLTSVSGNLVFRNIANCPEISLPQLKEIHGDLIVEGNSGLGHVAFTGPVLVDGSVRIVNNSGTNTDIDTGGGSVGGDLDISGNTGADSIDVGQGQIGGDLTVENNGGAIVNISDSTTISGDLTIETTGDLSGTTGGGSNDVTILGGAAALHAVLPQGAFDGPVGFAITRHTDPPQDGEAADGSNATIDAVMGFRFAFDVPTLNANASLTFTVDMSQLDAAGRADLLNALASGAATIVGKGDDPDADYRAFPVCTDSQTPAADGCVAIAFLDANGNPTGGFPAFVRFDGVVGHFSSYAVAVVTPAADTTPPVITRNPAADSCSMPGDNDWCRGMQTAGFTATDAGSAITSPCAAAAGESCDFKRSTSTEGSAAPIVSGQVCDEAGNCNPGIDAGPFAIDSTAPGLAPTVGPAPILLHGTAAASAHATDATSGVASESCEPVDTGTAGVHTLACTAKDGAGNVSTTEVGYLVGYRILGFFSPAPKSKWKAGQTVPLKVPLADSNGVRIPDAEAQALLTPVCRVAFAATGAQSASGCMKYDPGDHQFLFNWKLGQQTGSVTIGVTVGYAGTATTTTLSEPIVVTS